MEIEKLVKYYNNNYYRQESSMIAKTSGQMYLHSISPQNTY